MINTRKGKQKASRLDEFVIIKTLKDEPVHPEQKQTPKYYRHKIMIHADCLHVYNKFPCQKQNKRKRPNKIKNENGLDSGMGHHNSMQKNN